jgi:hypothetical protein
MHSFAGGKEEYNIVLETNDATLEIDEEIMKVFKVILN